MAAADIPLQIGRLCRNLPATLLFRLTGGLVIMLLVSVTLLGIRQYHLCQQCRKVVTESDLLLFSFTAIKNHISEALFTGQPVDPAVVDSELQALAEKVQQLNTGGYLPRPLSAYQNARDDLINLSIQVRKTFGASGANYQESLTLLRSLSSINLSFQQFRIALGDHARTVLIGLQKMIIGALALTVVVACWTLLSINRHIALPILQIGNLMHDPPSLDMYSINDIVAHFSSESDLLGRVRNILVMLPRLPRAPHPPETVVQRWQAFCNVLADNPDYDLVWVGMRTTPSEHIEQVCSAGDLNDNSKEQHTLCPVVCGVKSGACFTIRQAITTREAISSTVQPASPQHMTSSGSLAGICPGSCATFPLRQGSSLWFLSIVSLQPRCFSATEMELLHLGLHQVLGMDYFGKRKVGNSPDSDLVADIEAGCCATCGHLGTAVGGTIINSLNGAINYCQMLKDCKIKPAYPPVQHRLNDALLLETKETAELVTCLLRFFRAMEHPDEYSPLSHLLHVLATILASALRADGIVLQTHCPHSATAGIPDKAWWLLLLNFFQMGRNALTVDAEEQCRTKTIHLSSAVNPLKERISLSLTNSSGQWLEPSMQQFHPWQTLAFCRQLIQLHQGQLRVVQGSGNSTVLQIELPLREENH